MHTGRLSTYFEIGIDKPISAILVDKSGWKWLIPHNHSFTIRSGDKNVRDRYFFPKRRRMAFYFFISRKEKI